MPAQLREGPLAPRWRDRRGAILLTGAVLIITLCGFMGLAVDVGYLQYARRRMQTAADSAAIAGAHEVKANNTGNIVTFARNDAALNGFTHGVRGVTVTVNSPPTSGAYAGDASAVETIVAQSQPIYFLRALNLSSFAVRARAVARLGSGPACMYVLDPAASNALVASGSANVQLQCGLYINSNNSKAMVTSGSACVQATLISIVGGYNNSSSCGPSPAPDTGADVQADPLSYVQPPTFGGCNYTNFKVSSGFATLNPGVYCNGIIVSGSATTAVLNPGTYILNGGGLTVSGGASIQGTGVSFYNTQGAASYKPIVVSGGSSTHLSAPTTGPLAGILFFQDRNVVSSSQNTVSGGSSTVFQGALYFPTTPLTYSGGSTGAAAYTIIVANRVTFSGGSRLNNDYSSLPGGSPIKGSVVLGE